MKKGSGASEGENAFRLLPSVEEVLRRTSLEELADGVPRPTVVEVVQATISGWRDEVRAGSLAADALAERLANGALESELARRFARERGAGVRRAINATGVVLHTGLGRAPLHPEAAEAVRDAAGYAVLELDRESGERGRRDERVSELARRLLGAEAAIAVNNNAAAVLLALQTFAFGREAVLSRGELVEIGGSFRMPDVMERAGARLVEVGTTNRTRLADYADAVGPATGVLLKVHTSNFRLEGFVESVSAAELAGLGRERGVRVVYDLGSGLVEDDAAALPAELADEPRARDALASGCDAVTFSGDKLLGGPQAGICVGRRDAVEAMRANPLYRALRLDKLALAALEATLSLYLSGRAAEIPARAALARGRDSLDPLARSIAERIGALAGFRAEVVGEGSQAGSGSAPGVLLPTRAVRVRWSRGSAGELARALRAGEPPVFARVQEGSLLLDPRTLLAGEDAELVLAFAALA